MQKRTRKSVVRQGFEPDKYYESEEYHSESDIKSISDFTDSEDEWGALNQPKNKVKPLQRTSSKLVELEKQLREKDKISKKKTKVLSTNKKDKSIKSVESLKIETVVKCTDNTNTFVNSHNKRLVNTNNIDSGECEEVVLIDSDKEENEKTTDGLKQVDIINLDEEDMQNDCEILNDNFETSISSCTENIIKKTNDQDNYKKIEDDVISIEDDQIIISDDEDDIQFVSMTVKPKGSPLNNNNKPRSLKTNLNKSHNSVSANRQVMSTNYTKSQSTSSIIHNISQNVTIMPANVHLPKGIEVTMVKTPRRRIDSHFNSIKRRSTVSNGRLPDNPSIINVKCEVISKPNLNGEVSFYIRLPNGKEQPGPNELINQYLKQHNNQLPDYWLVPLSVEVAKQYGIN